MKHLVRSSISIAALSLPLLAGAAVASAATPVVKTSLFGRFSAPVAVVQPPGATADLWVVQKRGQIIVVRNSVPLATKALDIASAVSFDAEQGLLGLAFPADFATSKLVYVTYTDRANALVLAEYRATGSVLDPTTKRIVMTVPKPFADHNAGTIRFGSDGFLYMSVGDGGTGPSGSAADPYGNAQNLGSLLGKILRIDPRASGGQPYVVPSDNPFSLTPGARPEIWHYGLRNPWKWSFGPDGAMWIGDVGMGTHEEVDRAAAGGLNFGWRIVEGTRLREGTSIPAGLTPPLHAYRHGKTTGCAVTGGVVVTDAQLPSKLRGAYIFSDFCVPTIRTITVSSRGAVTVGSTGVSIPGGGPTSIDADLSGRIYISTIGGAVYRLLKR